MKKINLSLVLLTLTLLGAGCISQNKSGEQQENIRIGWISALTGPVTKYGADKAALIAVDEINGRGGIHGRKLELVMEDGKCTPRAAADAAHKLINVDHVQIILGGHCSPETVAAAPIAQQNKVLILASLSSNPDISHMGDYVFRTTAVSAAQAPIMVDAMQHEFGARTLVTLYEETSYAKPIATAVADEFVARGGTVLSRESFLPEEKDYRTLLTRIKSLSPDAIYISPQDSDKAGLIVKQLLELGMKTKIFGNEVVGAGPTIEILKDQANGIITPLPVWDKTEKKPKVFIDAYIKKYGVEPPYGILTAESYDAVYMIADAIERYGMDVGKIKGYLDNLKNYSGASGMFSLDENGDALREYRLMIIRDGKNIPYE